MLKRIVMVLVVAFLLRASSFAQEKPSADQVKKVQEISSITAEFQRLAFDRRLADDLELTPDQKRKLLILAQTQQDKMLSQRRKPGQKFDFEEYKKQADKVAKEAKELLSEKQWEKLSELAEERKKNQASYSPDQAKELQRMSGLMQELMRLSYDRNLAEELEITVEQRVEIREVQQEFQAAMQERTKGGQFDVQLYNKLMGDLMVKAQSILTSEQSEKLMRSAKLKRLKRQYGDPFAMINGLVKDYDLDKEESQEISEAIRDAREDYYAKLKELKDDTLDQIMGKVPAKHRDEIREAVTEFLDEDPRKKQGAFFGSIAR